MHDEADYLADLAQARAETRAAFENRAIMYYHLFEAFAEEVGRDTAVDVMKRAIYRRGLDVGRKYAAAAEARDFDEVGRLFCEGSPCGGALFEPGVEAVDSEGIVLRMTACPLVDAWRTLGLAPEEIDTLCEIAASVDEGTFEGAGLELTFKERLGTSGASRCILELRSRSL